MVKNVNISTMNAKLDQGESFISATNTKIGFLSLIFFTQFSLIVNIRCQNGGQCVDGVDDYVCKCRNEFRGMFCECLQNTATGELDCNYTLIDKMKTTTIKSFDFSTELHLLTTTPGFMTTTRYDGSTEEMSHRSSSITQIVPITTTSTFYSPSSSSSDDESSVRSTTMEILDLSRETTAMATTTENYDSSSSTERFETSPSRRSTAESTIETFSTSNEITSILTTRASTNTKTTKMRPCPPEMTRPPTTTKPSPTVRHSETSTILSTSDSDFPSSTASSTSTKIDEVIQTSDSSSWISTSEISASSSQHEDSVSELSTKSFESTSTTMNTDNVETNQDSTTMMMMTSEIISTHENSTTEIDKMTNSEDVTTPNEVTITASTDDLLSTSTLIPEEITPFFNLTSTPSTPTTFNPTDEMFTLTQSDVTTITLPSASCKEMECFNGGICENTSEGPKCVCRFDRQDPQCRTLINIKKAAFAGDSYLSHKIYSAKSNQETTEAKSFDHILPMKISLKARTRANDGLILLATAQGSKGGHYTALFLHNGLLQFQFSCGLQTMLLSELEAPINTGHEFSIQVALDFSANHSHCNASLRINDTLAMSGDQPTWLGVKSVGESRIENIWLHLGGSPQTPVVLMSELPGGQGFTGCLHTLKINDEPKEIFRLVHDSD